MKQLLFSFSILFAYQSFSQSFATLDGSLYKTDYVKTGWGIDFTGGAFLNNKNEKGSPSFMAGLGVGMYMFTENDVYIPIFATFGYCNSGKRISPYLNGRMGYAFYKGSASFIGRKETVKGGLYANARGGAAFKVTRKFRAVPFIGLSLIMLRKVQAGQAGTEYNNGLVNAGISLLFGGK